MAKDSKRPTGVVLTPAELRSRRSRNIAIGLAVAFFALLFYGVTIAKLVTFGPAGLQTGDD
jgi:hypothetical protein